MLTERKKADRSAMLAAVIEIAEEQGARILDQWEEGERLGPRERGVYIRGERGLAVTIDFDGQSCQPDIHVLGWHFARDADPDVKLKKGIFLGSEVNPFHQRKCTTVCEGFDSLTAMLTAGLTAARDGWAFESTEG